MLPCTKSIVAVLTLTSSTLSSSLALALAFPSPLSLPLVTPSRGSSRPPFVATAPSRGFTVPPLRTTCRDRSGHPTRCRAGTRLSQATDDDDLDNVPSSSSSSPPLLPPSRCWNPSLRRTLAAIASLGLLETGYLTLDKLSYQDGRGGGGGGGLVGAICTGDAAASPSCSDVLHGPYASLHLAVGSGGGGVDVPLSSLGMAAYATVLALAAFPLRGERHGNFSGSAETQEDGAIPPTAVVDADNRILLLGATTLMASFSVYLVSLILGVLHATCAFCFASAGFSIALAVLTWAGGALPSKEEAIAATAATGDDDDENDVGKDVVEWRKKGVALSASSVGAATVVALGLFLGVDDPNYNGYSSSSSSSFSSSPSSPFGSTLLASTDKNNINKNTPPPITTTSTPQALSLAADLSALDSKMYGAFWCSHCYDQKQSLGSEAMRSIPYVECDRDGYHTQRDLCRAKDVPGYPTWEIGGELFPGERSVDELREIVDGLLAGKK
ncbi:hypothetical protein ACHAXS_001724 [Conticribra weissflogii]